MAPTNTRQFLPPFTPIFDGNGLWSPMQADGFYVTVYFQQGSTSSWVNIEFTRVGREIGSLLPRPDYETNMREAAGRLPQDGLTKIALCAVDKPPEVLWQAAS